MHSAEPGIESGTTASEIVPVGNTKRNEACPRTGPPDADVMLRLAQPSVVETGEPESTTFCAPLGGIVNV